MRELLDEIETCRVLFWISERTPDEDYDPNQSDAFITHPAFVDRTMLEAVAPMADLVVEYVPQKVHAPVEVEAVDSSDLPKLPVPGEFMHAQAASLLSDPLRDILSSQASAKRRWMIGGT